MAQNNRHFMKGGKNVYYDYNMTNVEEFCLQ